MKISRFTSLIALAAIACAASLAACSTVTSPPTDSQVALINDACAADAIARPTVDVLQALTGLATPAEAAALTAARGVIDQVCANPTGSPQANALASIKGASSQIAAIVAKLEARKAAATPPSRSSAS